MNRDVDKVMFGSSEWLAIAREVLTDLVKTQADPDGRFSMCEVWTNVPAGNVGVSESGRAGFHLRVQGITSELSQGEVGDVDLKFVLDYETAARLARETFGEGNQESSPAVDVESSPAMEVQGDVTLMPSYMQELHNRLVPRTA
jgi:hypothetical protein